MLVQFAFTSHWWVLSLHSSRSKKRKKNNTSNQPRTSFINLDIQRKKIINFVAFWLLQGRLIVSLIARRASINPGGGVPPVMAYTGKLRPNCKRGTFSRLQVDERVRISIVEVYERVEKSVPFRSVKGPKRANRRILWLWKSPENFLAGLQQLKVKRKVPNWVFERGTICQLKVLGKGGVPFLLKNII